MRQDLENMSTMHHQENGTHREMAVDVPESFIAQNKTQPRYPPPRTLNNQQPLPPTIPSKPHIDDPPPPIIRPIPPPRDHITYSGDSRQMGPPIIQDKKPNSKIGQVLEPTPDQLDSIKKFQEQLRLRRENQDRMIARNEFLRNSLRESRKLQALESNPALHPTVVSYENEAYLVGEEEMTKYNNIMGESYAQVSFSFERPYQLSLLQITMNFWSLCNVYKRI